ncbi:MAG: hypothetical protein ACRD9L_00040, partial [Bryobacteraceae bacterium]
PSLLLYVAILFVCLRETYRIRKLGRTQPQFQELSLMAGCLFLSVVSFCLSGCFASIAVEFYFYTMVGFVIALSGVARRELQLATPVRMAGIPTAIPSPVGLAARPPERTLPPQRFSAGRDRRRRGNPTL